MRLKQSNLQIITQLIKLQENETEEWIQIDKGVEVTRSVTDEQIRDSIIQPEKSKAVEDSEEDDASVGQVKIS